MENAEDTVKEVAETVTFTIVRTESPCIKGGLSGMKVVIAIDSFKGSISSPDAGAAIREGIHRVFPDAEVFVRPLADGG